MASTYPRWRGDPEPGFVHELSKRLVERFDVRVLCPHTDGALPRETLDGVDVVRYRYAPARLEKLVNDGGIVANLKRSPWKWLLVPGFLACMAFAFLRLTMTWRPNVTHAHWLVPQGLLAAAASLLGLRYVTTSHGADLFALRGAFLRPLKRFVVDRSEATTVVSKAMRDELLRLGAPPKKISVLSMGVDLRNTFTVDPHVERSKDELLFVGRLVEKKGVGHLLAVLPVVRLRHPKATLTIVGFGPEEAALREQSRRLGLEPHVRFVGAIGQVELPAFYRRAALFVAPFVKSSTGDEEGLGLVVVEAIGCGCPVLVGEVAATHDLPVRRVSSVNVGAFEAAISEMLASGTALQDETARSRQVCLERFDWDAVAARYAGLLASASV
ncbi:glycosyltransferase [Luteimonas cucumeris]|nr:glycosyltransferase [Luteimonas cucumeris]